MDRTLTPQENAIDPEARLGAGVVLGHHVTIYPGVVVGDGVRILDGAVLGRPPLTAGNTTRKVPKEPGPLVVGAGSIVGANAVRLPAGPALCAVVARTRDEL